MTDRHAIGKALTKASAQIIKQRKIMILFPILNVILTVSTLLLILIPIEKFEAILANNKMPKPSAFVLIFVLFSLFFLVIHLLNTLTDALVTTTTSQVINKNTFSAWDILKTTFRSSLRLCGWVHVVIYIGIPITLCQTWMDNWYDTKIARRWLCQTPWLVGTSLAIPSIILENIGPITAIKRSSSLIKAHWGSANKIRLSVGPILAGIRVACLIPAIISALIAGVQGLYIGAPISIILLFCTSIFTTLTRVTTMCALYFYATSNDKINQFYDPELLKRALYQTKKA